MTDSYNVGYSCLLYTSQWQTKTTVANLQHEGKEIILRIISDNMPSERAVPCEATLEDLYLFYFSTEEGVK